MSRFRLCLSIVCLASIPAALAADRITGREFATRSEVYAPHAMAARHPDRAGRDAVRR